MWAPRQLGMRAGRRTLSPAMEPSRCSGVTRKGMAETLPSGSTPLPARGNRPSVISITGDAMRGATEGTTTGWYAKELDERASIAWSSVDGNLDAYLSPGDEMSGRLRVERACIIDIK